jgi:predicted GNAT family N-acyltransferase
MMMTMCVEQVEHNSQAYHAVVSLREAILLEPLGLSFSQEQLEGEAHLVHVACYFHDQLAGCLILQPEGAQCLKMRQVAVSGEHQGLGIGRALVEFSEQFAKKHGYSKICMHARETAVGFYLKLGYEVEGQPFEEVTIPHRSMFKNIQ